jgi:hypothetical protein
MDSNDKQLVEVNKNIAIKEKTAKVAKKIDNLVFNVKFLNITAAILIALFAVMFTIFGSIAITNENLLQQEYEKRLKLIELYNQNYINASVMGSSSSSTETQEEAKFQTAKEAVAYAFDRFYGYDSFEMTSYGVTDSKAAGISAEIVFDTLVCKYSNGTIFNQILRHETKTNYGMNYACQSVFKNNKRYKRAGTNLKVVNGELTAEFNTQFTEKTETLFTTWMFYIINEDTITASKYLTTMRSAMGKITGYYASVELSPETSITDYALSVQDNGETSLPEFEYVYLNCEIDRNGDLVTFSIEEKMACTKKMVIKLNVTSTNKTKYTMVSHNTAPSVAEPQI